MRNTIMKNKQINIMLSIYMSCAAVTIYLLNYYTPLYRNGLKINFFQIRSSCNSSGKHLKKEIRKE